MGTRSTLVVTLMMTMMKAAGMLAALMVGTVLAQDMDQCVSDTGSSWIYHSEDGNVTYSQWNCDQVNGRIYPLTNIGINIINDMRTTAGNDPLELDAYFMGVAWTHTGELEVTVNALLCHAPDATTCRENGDAFLSQWTHMMGRVENVNGVDTCYGYIPSCCTAAEIADNCLVESVTRIRSYLRERTAETLDCEWPQDPSGTEDGWEYWKDSSVSHSAWYGFDEITGNCPIGTALINEKTIYDVFDQMFIDNRLEHVLDPNTKTMGINVWSKSVTIFTSSEEVEVPHDAYVETTEEPQPWTSNAECAGWKFSVDEEYVLEEVTKQVDSVVGISLGLTRTAGYQAQDLAFNYDRDCDDNQWSEGNYLPGGISWTACCDDCEKKAGEITGTWDDIDMDTQVYIDFMTVDDIVDKIVGGITPESVVIGLAIRNTVVVFTSSVTNVEDNCFVDGSPPLLTTDPPTTEALEDDTTTGDAESSSLATASLLAVVAASLYM